MPIIEPGIRLINKLSFKYKIIFVFSIVFILLTYQSIINISRSIDQTKVYDKQLISLSYTSIIQELITKIQLHRGLVNGYLSGKKSFLNKIKNTEKDINKSIKNLQNKNAKETLTQIYPNLQSLFLKNLSSKDKATVIFNKHTKIINILISKIHNFSQKNSFGINKDLILNQLAKILTDHLPKLQEITGKLRGISVGLFSQKYLTDYEKSTILELYTQIKILAHSPIDKNIQKKIHNQYPIIIKDKKLMRYRLNNMLFVVKNYFFTKYIDNFSGVHFFQLATDTIDSQQKLYNTIANTYKNRLQKLQQDLSIKITLIAISILVLFMSFIYIASSFYYSIQRSVKKLQNASTLIAQGKTDIHLEADTQDEIGQALLAFNHMSKQLDRNISFLNSYKKAIDNASIVSKTDTKGIITYVNDTFCKISGYTKEELIGKPHNIVRHPDVPKQIFKQMWDSIKNGQTWHNIIPNKTKMGDTYIVDALIMPICDNHGKTIEYIAIRHDVTELEMKKKQVEKEMRKQKIDPLTKLKNRLGLIEDLPNMKKPIMLYLNIDNFAHLNDFYGADIGNSVLSYVSTLLKTKLSKQKINIYRLQSDEFLLVYEKDAIQQSPQKLIFSLIEYIELKTSENKSQDCISITLTGSIATYKESNNYEDLLSYVILARKAAQKEYKKYISYSTKLHNGADYQKNIEWINKIKDALNEDRIVAFFQPIIENKSDKIHKYEALVRMKDIDGKIVSPYFFLDIAKQAKLYTKITKIMFEKTFSTFEDKPEYEFSINITEADIIDEEIAKFIIQKIQNFPYPKNIVLEITESEEIKDYEKVNIFISKAKKLGAKIAIDDFGSGYSNFEHIIKMDADFIKIDGSLIKNIQTDQESRIITEAIIAFSKKLGSKTIVEFVHNQSVQDIVKEIGADYSQGFHLGEPTQTLEEVALV